jgi:hypothetical protein
VRTPCRDQRLRADRNRDVERSPDVDAEEPRRRHAGDRERSTRSTVNDGRRIGGAAEPPLGVR